jgi:hypothetical protein
MTVREGLIESLNKCAAGSEVLVDRQDQCCSSYKTEEPTVPANYTSLYTQITDMIVLYLATVNVRAKVTCREPIACHMATPIFLHIQQPSPHSSLRKTVYSILQVSLLANIVE